MAEVKLMESLPRVDVIIVTYNGAGYIGPLLDSILNQSYPAYKTEIIVLDNASEDGTASIVKKNYPGVKLTALNENIGYAAGNNRALSLAGGDILVFLNQDTICHKEWLKSLIICLLQHPFIGACTSNMIMSKDHSIIDAKTAPDMLYFYDLSPFGYGKYYRDVEHKIVFTKIVSGCSFAVKMETIKELGYLFDEDLWMYVEDTDLSLRMHNYGYKTCAAKDSVVYHLHKDRSYVGIKSLRTASTAIMNRVYAFFKNMTWLEFTLFFPVLFIGGIFKIFEFRLSPFLKALYFIPFAIFSMLCMLVAIHQLPGFMDKRRSIVSRRSAGRLYILKLILAGDSYK